MLEKGSETLNLEKNMKMFFVVMVVLVSALCPTWARAAASTKTRTTSDWVNKTNHDNYFEAPVLEIVGKPVKIVLPQPVVSEKVFSTAAVKKQSVVETDPKGVVIWGKKF